MSRKFQAKLILGVLPETHYPLISPNRGQQANRGLQLAH